MNIKSRQRYFLIVYVILFCVFGCTNSKQNTLKKQSICQIDSLLESKEVFKAARKFTYDRYMLPEFNQLIYTAVLENYFNKSEKSNRAINQLFDKYFNSMNDSIRSNLLQVRYQNHIKLYNYAYFFLLSIFK